jgi:hypothetical protein
MVWSSPFYTWFWIPRWIGCTGGPEENACLGVVRQRLEKNHNLMGRWRYCKIASHFITAIMAQLLVSQK